MESTCVTPAGRFVYGIHKPCYRAKNLREGNYLMTLGHFADGAPQTNHHNFPRGDIEVENGKWIYEIANPFPFRGTTYIDSAWADERKKNPDSISLPVPPVCSLRELLRKEMDREKADAIFSHLPKPLLYGLAATSTDPEELALMAENCCRLEKDSNGKAIGLGYVKKPDGRIHAQIDDFELFETIANNPSLPDDYKKIMVLRPGVQGTSPIVGEVTGRDSHVFEYLRTNSYIPWGHFASNTAHDQVRYRTSDLSLEDMSALRHLYYQRIYTILAGQLDLLRKENVGTLSEQELETMRLEIIAELKRQKHEKKATLWGWNFGYDMSASGYRLHASHQQIHQQFAMVPEVVDSYFNPAEPVGSRRSYSCGDLVSDHIARYYEETGSVFFDDYISALRNNERMDGNDGEKSLIVFSDEHVMLYVPKAQISQWELQLMVTADAQGIPVGNIVEADMEIRRSLDRGILVAQQVYAKLGARMVTSIEYSKRLGEENGQRLLYSFLPKLPWAMGAFSEAQLRFICGHYPEDFAIACRAQLKDETNP